MLQTDIAIVGTGLAGLTAALHLAPHRKVVLISKRALLDGASQWAQGGIAAVLDGSDSHEQHIRDTLVAGAGLCDLEATRYIVEHGREAIEWLINEGVPFTRDNTPFGFHLTREGGHAVRRIIHAADATGRAVQQTLEKRVREHPNITLLEDHMAIDLITVDGRCAGLYVLECGTGSILTIAAGQTILATGGAGKVYLYTTNPDTATGDGIAMAWRAGCRVSNMEFIQFHPTCLYHPHAKSFLITEAVRGEGGHLVRPDGSRCMPAHDERAELAPRDVVARAIDFEMKKRGLDCVYLDISHRPPEFVQEHFPNIHAKCLELGIDITKEPIPVVPAAHYTCGGVITDLHGRTDLPGLYVAGETSCTGLHGANRLASNSLLECVVMARAAVADILATPSPAPAALREWDESRVTDAEEEVVIAHNWDELRLLMWNYVGIVRSDLRLHSAERRIALIRGEVQGFYARYRVSRDLLELRNLVDVAELVVNSALSRHESRGLHYSRDYPGTDLDPRPTVLQNPRRLMH